MFIASFPAGPWQTNCYLAATAPGEECVIIDPGLDAVAPVRDLVAEHRLAPVAVLLTHGHIDHTFSVVPLCTRYAAACWIGADDRILLREPARAMDAAMHELLVRLTGTDRLPEPDDVRELADRDTVTVAGLEFDALHAPGHTPGSTMFRAPHPRDDVEAVVFSGDVLFAGSIGRTDLPGGDARAMLHSLRTKVAPLPDGTVVLPGHGPQTTIARERRDNPFLANLERSAL